MNTEKISDEEIIMLIREEDEVAKTILFNKYKPTIDVILSKFHPSFNKLGIERQEAFGEALVGFSDALKSYKDNKDASFATFLSLCVKRRIMKLIRKYNTEKMKIHIDSYSLDYIYQTVGVPLVEIIESSYVSDPLEQITDEEDFKNLESKIRENLSEFEYEIYEYLVDEFNYNDIAILTGKNLKQIDNAIQRIKNKIKEIIKRDEE